MPRVHRAGREIKPEAVFLIITGHGVHLSRMISLPSARVKGVLHKPFGWRTLASEIVRHWSGSDVPVVKQTVVSG